MTGYTFFNAKKILSQDRGGFSINMVNLKSIFSKIKTANRRKGSRFNAHQKLYLNYRSLLSAALNGPAAAKDLSTTGIRFAAEQEIPQGTALNLSLHLYPVYRLAKTLQLQGKVVRSYRKSSQKHYRIACAFDSLERNTQKEIDNFVTWLKKQN